MSGVLALLKSRHPKATETQLEALLKAQADNPGCPADPYDGNGDGKVDAVCATGTYKTGFYGHGIADALNAVTK